MFDDIPENYTHQTADNEEEGWRYTQGDKNARRPPELLTRDHVARCIMREVKAGRGSPHGGVFLDIAWIKEKLPNAAEHIKKKLPSMYHQFKQLADLDITTTPMEVGPTTHYMMGGIRVDGDTQMSTVPGLFAAGEVRGRTARRQPARRQLALGPAGVRQARRRARGQLRQGARRRAHRRRAGRARRNAGRSRRSIAGRRARTRTPIQHELQGMMQDLVGIVRQEAEMREALDKLDGSARARRTRRRRRQPRVQPRLAHGARPAQPADGVRGDRARGDRAQGEPRRALPRGLPETSPTSSRRSTSSCRRAPTARWHSAREPIPPMPRRAEAGHRGEQVAMADRRRSASGAASAARARFEDYQTEVGEGMVVLDAVHQIQAEQANDLACAGTARPASAARARPRSTASRS